MKRQQRAHGKLASLSRIVARAQEKKRAAKKSRKAILGLQQGGGAQGADAAVGTGMRGEEGASASGTTGLVPVGESASEQHGCFVHLEAIEPEHRACTMCKRDYCVEYVDGDRVGEIGFSKFPVKLSCGHLVCFGCARVLIRMYVNCNECGASFGDGRVELTRVEKQIQSLMVENRLAANDVVQLTREDVEGALALLHLTGKIFAMEDIEAGLALLDLQAGTDTTLEDYLLVISRQ